MISQGPLLLIWPICSTSPNRQGHGTQGALDSHDLAGLEEQWIKKCETSLLLLMDVVKNLERYSGG